ncbi:MAG: iron ABC transporter substrate-binding protein [Dehalococcoidia bacterium]|nr:iron ABC transporter substrate-binding protein [Dehalococcoidia bacterium]
MTTARSDRRRGLASRRSNHGSLTRRWLGGRAAGVAAGLVLAACGEESGVGGVVPAQVSGPLTVYSGRKETLVGPLLERYQELTGVDVKTRYGGTAELAAAILEEGENSPANVFFAQDVGALGALAAAGRLSRLPSSLLESIEPRFRSPGGVWVGLSGRARVVVYNTEELQESDLPDTIWGFTGPKWKGQLGWPPTNGSFQAFVTALRITDGEERAREWLEKIKANEPRRYRNNTTIVDATAKGEVLAGFVNHYYLFRFLKEHGESFTARNYHPRAGGPGAIINLAGAGVLASSQNPRAATHFVDYMLSQDAQQYFASETFEYPLIEGIETHSLLVPLDQIETPEIDLSNLADLRGTLELLRTLDIL